MSLREGYRLVLQRDRYLQIVQDTRTADGHRSTRLVKHIGTATPTNRERGRRLVDFLNTYATRRGGSPTPIGTIDQELGIIFKLGVLIGPLNIPLGPMILWSDFIYSLNFYLSAGGDVSSIVAITHPNMDSRGRGRLTEWINSLPTSEDRATALFFRWRW